MKHSDDKRPSPRRLARAGVAVVSILAAIVVVFFFGRLIWHDEVEEADPLSVQAPDDARGNGGDPGANGSVTSEP